MEESHVSERAQAAQVTTRRKFLQSAAQVTLGAATVALTALVEEPLPAWAREVMPTCERLMHLGHLYRRSLRITGEPSASDLRKIVGGLSGLSVHPIGEGFRTACILEWPSGDTDLYCSPRFLSPRHEVQVLAWAVACHLCHGDESIGYEWRPDKSNAANAAAHDTARQRQRAATQCFLAGLNGYREWVPAEPFT